MPSRPHQQAKTHSEVCISLIINIVRQQKAGSCLPALLFERWARREGNQRLVLI